MADVKNEVVLNFVLTGRVLICWYSLLELNSKPGPCSFPVPQRHCPFLADVGHITKVVPDETTLSKAYRRIRQQAKVQLVIDEALDNMDEDEGDVPDTLARKISELQNAEPTLTWDAALKRIVFNTKDDKGSKQIRRK